MVSDYVTPYQQEMIRNQCDKLKKLVPRLTTFIDIGVGKLGSEAWFVRNLWRSCEIFGFEPCLNRYNYLKREYPGWLINMAVAEDYNYIHGYEGIDFVVKCRSNEIDSYKSVHVESTSLDRFLSEFHKGNIIVWADIEGSELRMLQGATSLLKKGAIAALNLELNSQREADGWCTADEVVEFLAQYGYIPYDLPKEKFDHADVIFTKGKSHEHRIA